MAAAQIGRGTRSDPRAPTEPWSPDDPWSVRILQRMGPVSLGVSVPRAWVERHELHVGSPVQMRIASDGSLRLRTRDGARPADRRLDVAVSSGLHPEHLFRRLLGGYLSGAVEFEIHETGAISASTRNVVRSFTRRTIQPEIVSEEKALLRLQDVSDSNPIPLSKLVGRMGQLVLALHLDAGQSWGRLKIGDVPAWEARDDEVDRQAWFIERSAVRMLDGDGASESVLGGIGPLGWWTVARSLERIADHAVRIGEVGGRLSESAVPPQYLTSLGQFHNQALAHLTAVLEALAEESAARANELLDTGEALHAMGRTLSERLFSSTSAAAVPPSSAIALGQILDSIGRTTAYAQDIAQVALDRALPLTVGTTVPSSPITSRATKSPKETKQGTRNQGGTQKK